MEPRKVIAFVSFLRLVSDKFSRRPEFFVSSNMSWILEVVPSKLRDKSADHENLVDGSFG